MNRVSASGSRLFLTLAVGALVSGCVLRPAGLDDERGRLAESAQAFERPLPQRSLPELPTQPQWEDVLHRAFLANGELEAAYFQWKAALERVDVAGTYPNVNVEVGFEYMFSSQRMKSWDRLTVRGQLDRLMLPLKVSREARMALTMAQAAGARFEAAKFSLQRDVLVAWHNYTLLGERIRIAQDNVNLLKLISETAAARVRAGASQQDLLKAQIESELAVNELRNMEAEAPQMRAMLNAMLGRQPQAPLQPPPQPASRPVPDDRRILEAGVRANPELAALELEVRAGQDALELARMRFLPDVSPMAALTGGASQMIGAMVMLPTALPAIRGAIREARAQLHRLEAVSRQSNLDTAATFVATLYAMRNSERQIDLFERTVLPMAEQVFANSRQAYASGAVGFIELIDSQRTLLEVKLMIAEARAAREIALARLEALAGVDIETLGDASSIDEARSDGE